MRLKKCTSNWELLKYSCVPAVEIVCDLALLSAVGHKNAIPWGQSAQVSKFAVLESSQEMVTSAPTALSALSTSMLAMFYPW